MSTEINDLLPCYRCCKERLEMGVRRGEFSLLAVSHTWDNNKNNFLKSKTSIVVLR